MTTWDRIQLLLNTSNTDLTMASTIETAHQIRAFQYYMRETYLRKWILMLQREQRGQTVMK